MKTKKQMSVFVLLMMILFFAISNNYALAYDQNNITQGFSRGISKVIDSSLFVVDGLSFIGSAYSNYYKDLITRTGSSLANWANLSSFAFQNIQGQTAGFFSDISCNIKEMLGGSCSSSAKATQDKEGSAGHTNQKYENTNSKQENPNTNPSTSSGISRGDLLGILASFKSEILALVPSTQTSMVQNMERVNYIVQRNVENIHDSISETANGGDTAFSGKSLTVTGNVTANSFVGDGSLLTGITSGATNTDQLIEGTSNLFSQWSTNGTNVYYNGGNIGIGTATPTASLQVNIANNSTNFAANQSQVGLQLQNTDSTTNNWSLIQSTSANNGTEAAIGFQHVNPSSSYADIAFGTNGSGGWGERMRITSDGNIGIGTTTPNHKLTVEGDINFTGSLYQNGSAFGGWATNTDSLTEGTTNKYFSNTLARNAFSTTATGLAYSTSTGILSLTSGYNIPTDASTTAWNNKISSQWTTTSTDIFYTAGNVGVGTSTPSQKLDIWGNLKVGTSSVPNLFVNTAINKVGIGTTTPSHTFTVAGDINYTGTLYNNGIAASGSQWTTSGSDIYYTTGKVGIGTSTISSKLDVSTASIGSTPTATSGLALINPTAAVNNSQQYSPAVRWTGYGWKTNTNTSIEMSFRSYVVPVQGATNPTGYLSFGGGAAGAYADDLFKMDNIGILTASRGLITGTGSITSNTSGLAVGIGAVSGIAAIAGGTSSGGGTIIASGSGSLGFGFVSSGGALSSENTGSVALGLATGAGKTLKASGAGSFAGGNTLSGNILSSGQGSFVWGDAITGSADLATAFGKGFTNSTANSFMIGYSAAPTFAVVGSNVGIGTTTPTATTTVVGTVRLASITGAGANLVVDATGNVTASSDERLKDIDNQFTRGLADVIKIDPITFHWKKETGFDTLRAYTGFSAQNVRDAIPEAISDGVGGFLSLADRPIIAALVNAVKELNTKIESISVWFAGNKLNIQNDVCVDDICITKEEFKTMLLNNGGADVPTSEIIPPVDATSTELIPPDDTTSTDPIIESPVIEQPPVELPPTPEPVSVPSTSPENSI